MQWNEIIDPRDEVAIVASFHNLENEYLPEEVQKMINENGMLDAVHTINEHLNLKSDHYGLYLTNQNGKRTLVDA